MVAWNFIFKKFKLDVKVLGKFNDIILIKKIYLKMI